MQTSLVETDNQIDTLLAINAEIQRAHFPAIIGHDQTEYMLRTRYTPDAIKKYMQAGEVFVLVRVDESDVGFFSYQLEKPKDRIQLCKIFLKEAARGHGVLRKAVNYIAAVGKENGVSSIFLTVNRNNADPIAAYKHIGFKVTSEKHFDIGEGYVMDDFIMSMNL